MNSESIVVLVLIALAIGFIIWVRMKSDGHARVERAENNADDAERFGDVK